MIGFSVLDLIGEGLREHGHSIVHCYDSDGHYCEYDHGSMAYGSQVSRRLHYPFILVDFSGLFLPASNFVRIYDIDSSKTHPHSRMLVQVCLPNPIGDGITIRNIRNFGIDEIYDPTFFDLFDGIICGVLASPIFSDPALRRLAPWYDF